MSEIFGKRVMQLLKERRLSQRELAAEIGVTAASLSRYLNNQREPNGLVIVRAADALHTTTDYLLGHETDGVAGSQSH